MEREGADNPPTEWASMTMIMIMEITFHVTGTISVKAVSKPLGI